MTESRRFSTLFRKLGSGSVLEALEKLIKPNRSRWLRRRHGVLNGPALERALRAPGERDLAARGRTLRLLGRGAEARDSLRRALRQDRRNARAHAWLWEQDFGDGEDESAGFAGLNRAIALDPKNGLWLAWRAAARLSLGDCTGAELTPLLFDVEAALALEPGCALAHAVAGVALARDGKRKESLEALGRALALEPRQAWLYRARKDVRRALGDFDGFVADCEAACLIDEGVGYFDSVFDVSTLELGDREKFELADRYVKEHPGAYWMLALRADYRRSPGMNDFSGALDDFEAAVALRPDCSWAWAYLAKARMAFGRGPAAIEAIDRAISLRPECGWFHIWRGEIRRRLGDKDRFMADFDRGLELDPDYELGYAWRGGALRLVGENRRALADLNVAVALDCEHAWTLQERSLTLRALGRTSEALRDLDAAGRYDLKFSWCGRPELYPRALAELDRELERSPREALAYAWRADLKRRMNDLTGAERDLRRAVRLKPGYTRARAWLGRALDELGRRGEAMRVLDDAVARDERCPEAWALRGRLRFLDGRLEEAVADLDRAIELEKMTSWFFCWRAEAVLALGRRDQALRDAVQSLELDRGNPEALKLKEALA